MVYMLRSKDPSGEFVQSRWRTAELPRLGETVMLPDRDDWQEMTVEEVVHHPIEYEVWVGGSDGWGEGSVAELFEAARAFFQRGL